MKVKANKNSSNLVKIYHDNNQKNCKVGVGFDDYKSLKGKKSVVVKNKQVVDDSMPHILKDVPVFMKIIVEFDEEMLVIKQQ